MQMLAVAPTSPLWSKYWLWPLYGKTPERKKLPPWSFSHEGKVASLPAEHYLKRMEQMLSMH